MNKKQIKSGWSYILVLLVTIAFIASNVYIDFKNKAYASDQYLKVEVKYGDTIWGLANLYKSHHKSTTQEFINQVEDLNHMDADHLKNGQTIILPIMKRN